MDEDDDAIPGFSRHRRSNTPVDIIEISSDEECDSGQSHSTNVATVLVDLPIKQEKLSANLTYQYQYQQNVSNDSVRAKLQPSQPIQQSPHPNVAVKYKNVSNDSVNETLMISQPMQDHDQKTAQHIYDSIDSIYKYQQSRSIQHTFLLHLKNFSEKSSGEKFEHEFTNVSLKLCDLLAAKINLRYEFINKFLGEWLRIVGETPPFFRSNTFEKCSNHFKNVADALKQIGCFSIQTKILVLLFSYAPSSMEFTLLFEEMVTDTQLILDILDTNEKHFRNKLSDGVIRLLLNIFNDGPDKTVWSRRIHHLYFDKQLMETLPIDEAWVDFNFASKTVEFMVCPPYSISVITKATIDTECLQSGLIKNAESEDSEMEITFSLNRPLSLEHSSNSSKSIDVKEIVMHMHKDINIEEFQTVLQEMFPGMFKLTVEAVKAVHTNTNQSPNEVVGSIFEPLESIQYQKSAPTATVTSQSFVQSDNDLKTGLISTNPKSYKAPPNTATEYTAEGRNGIELIAASYGGCDDIEEVSVNIPEASYSTPYEYTEANEFDQNLFNMDINTNLVENQTQRTSYAPVGSNQILLLARQMATQMATKMIQDWKNKNIGNRRGKRRSDMVYDGYDHNYSLTVKQSKKENGNADIFPKNTNPNSYISNKDSQICVLCEKQYKRTVYHYKTSHEYAEVFVSRISPAMAEAAKNGSHSFRRYVKSSLKYLKAICLFCETEKDFSTYYWTNHIQSHTGEYANQCCICNKIVCFKTHCGHTTAKTDDFDLKVNNLYGYICRECNYVQINEDNIQKHLLNEHEFEDLNNRYDTIMLLPSWTAGSEVYSNNPGNSMKAHTDTILQNKNSQCPAVEPEILDSFERDQASTIAQNISGHLLVVPLNETIKVDEDEKQSFLSIFDRYNNVNRDDNGSILRPWLDGCDARKPLNIISQFALFKCMHSECFFATDAEEKWTAHMLSHLKFIEALNQKKWLSNENRKKHIEFRTCPYCFTELKANYQVTTHIESEHRRSIYQCKFCYFRSIEIDGMVLHHDAFHPEDPKEVLLCGDKREYLWNEGDIEDILWECEQQYFKQFKCGSCSEQFFYYDTFYGHLEKSHSCEYFCDTHCQKYLEYSEDVVQDHLKEHNYMEFQCLYCDDSFNGIDESRSHMAMRHPSKVMFVATRRSKPRLVYIGDSCDHSQFKFFKCEDLELLNQMDPTLTAETQRNKSTIGNKIEEQFLEQIPLNFYANMAEESFTTYRNYQQQNSTAVLYKCITEKAANEIKRMNNPSIDTNLECDCSQIFKITEDKGLAPYIDHLDEHRCFEVDNEKALIEHRLRKHPGAPIVYLKNGSHSIRCTFQCKLCTKHFETKSHLSYHYSAKHVDSIYAIGIIHNILSIGSLQRKIPFARTEHDRFNLVHLFHCVTCQEHMVTKCEALAHHYSKHGNSNHLEIHLKKLLIEHDFEKLTILIAESQNPQRMYLFECLHCTMLFDSILRVQEHTTELHPMLENKLIPRKLVACPICKIVSTHVGMEHHYLNAHENKSCCTVNALNTKICGSCNFAFTSIEQLSTHYRQAHITGETFTDSLLERMGVINGKDYTFETYAFAPGCCPQLKYNRIKDYVQHILVDCKRDFKCDECPKIFPELKTLVEHCRIDHKKTPDEIVESIQNIKQLLNGPLLVMEIIFSNGLTITRQAIKDTEFDMQLKAIFIKCMKNDFWPTEERQVHNFFL